MTPLAAMFAKELALPKAKRTMSDDAGMFDLIGKDMHCFDVSAVSEHVDKAIDHPDFWQDAQSMSSKMFLPSPITWLETKRGKDRWATIIQDGGDGSYFVSIAILVADRAAVALPLETFRIRDVLEFGERFDITTERIDKLFEAEPIETLIPRLKYIDRTKGTEETIARLDCFRALNDGLIAQDEKKIEKLMQIKFAISPDQVRKRIAFIILTLSLINTPGTVGMKQHPAHKGLQRQLNNVGSYTLRDWSEIVLKHHAIYDGGEGHATGPVYHKCLHFVRSHCRQLSSGRTIIIPAHWRGDPALGIKQTRYKVAL